MVLQQVRTTGEYVGAGWQAIIEGGYGEGSRNLPFMDMANNPVEEIPFHLPMKQINETHRLGSDVDEEK
jgi:hypothetical protein